MDVEKELLKGVRCKVLVESLADRGSHQNFGLVSVQSATNCARFAPMLA